MSKEEVIKEYILGFGKVVFYKNYLIIEVAEGASFNHEKGKELSVLTNRHFGNRPFGYISNRVNSYSLEPADYIRIKEVFPNLKAFAVVVHNKLQEECVTIENMFFHQEIITFSKLENAKSWMKEYLSSLDCS
ncbi:hypothetical protein M0D21_01490 [Aquimarina sp. D1M17]|uniref:hypothetical protein n=1 Tax=Aquimarina acroporae TaxID=2937283 RepID=UPI0020BF4DDA|nr:hypothetical protein [Aquimarina acroporae]MCK8520217.1 hypothetical protein [Aquimarina acroporae]